MSILVKGINMPKDIASNVHRTVTLIISGDGKIYDENRNRLPAVAVEVPTPHGRLVDYEEIEVCHWEDADGEHIDIDAPTVIDEEK